MRGPRRAGARSRSRRLLDRWIRDMERCLAAGGLPLVEAQRLLARDPRGLWRLRGCEDHARALHGRHRDRTRRAARCSSAAGRIGPARGHHGTAASWELASGRRGASRGSAAEDRAAVDSHAALRPRQVRRTHAVGSASIRDLPRRIHEGPGRFRWLDRSGARRPHLEGRLATGGRILSAFGRTGRSTCEPINRRQTRRASRARSGRGPRWVRFPRR